MCICIPAELACLMYTPAIAEWEGEQNSDAAVSATADIWICSVQHATGLGVHAGHCYYSLCSKYLCGAVWNIRAVPLVPLLGVPVPVPVPALVRA